MKYLCYIPSKITNKEKHIDMITISINSNNKCNRHITKGTSPFVQVGRFVDKIHIIGTLVPYHAELLPYVTKLIDWTNAGSTIYTELVSTVIQPVKHLDCFRRCLQKASFLFRYNLEYKAKC